jgi:two-component system, LuxR family, response regulator FixJ
VSDYRTIYVVDDDADFRDSIRMLLESAGFTVQNYASAAQFLADHILKGGCLIADIRMPDMDGLELQKEIIKRGIELPVIIITGHGDVPQAVRAMKAGAIDFIEKPFNPEHVLSSVRRALKAGQQSRGQTAEFETARDKLALLTPRERSALICLVNGMSNKIAAHELGISPRTIEIYRARIMDKMKAKSLSDLVRDAVRAGAV